MKTKVEVAVIIALFVAIIACITKSIDSVLLAVIASSGAATCLYLVD